MTVSADRFVLAFAADRRIADGPLTEALPLIQTAAQAGRDVLVFDAATGKVIDLDLRGTAAEALARLAPAPTPEEAEPEKRGPGRPKLGVVPREVTLLPRHWDWLAGQPRGVSPGRRKVVGEGIHPRERRERTPPAQPAT
ncbi:DUF2239 family protein, partial [Brevundimonas sp. FT23042]|uniref:DUF2239 family protein n=1 Tax=Brevundimonas sp. FT23042 TaxID=3393749 RepID=UPI003B589520